MKTVAIFQGSDTKLVMLIFGAHLETVTTMKILCETSISRYMNK